MTTKKTVRLVEVFAFVLFLLLFATAFVGSMRIAQAQSLPLGTRIVCFVYHDLNNFGSPIPLLTDPDCAATSTPVGGGNLTVIKDVSGGGASPADFEIHVMSAGTDISGSPQPGSSSGTSYVGIAPGTYVVSESGANTSQYSAAFSGTCSGSGAVLVFASSTSVCTITNTFNGTTTSGGGGSSSNTLTGTLTGTVTSGGTLTGTVGSTSSTTGTLSGTVGVGGTLTGTVTSPSGGTLTGTVVSPSSGGGGGGGGGGNGPIAGSLTSGGGGGGSGPLATTGGGSGSPAGQVLGASTGPSIPGVPNTGAGGNAGENFLVLAFSGAIIGGALTYLRRQRQ